MHQEGRGLKHVMNRVSRIRSVQRAAMMLAAACALAFPSGARAQQPPIISVTLDEAIERALKVHPQMAQAAGQVMNAEAAERSAWGAYLPTLSASAGTSLNSTQRFNPQTNTTATGSAGSYNGGVSASWEIFTGFRRSAARESARAQSRLAASQLISGRANVALTVSRAFFDVQRAEQLVSVAQSRIERAKQGIDAAKLRVAAGSATRSDLLRAELELNTARQALLEAETQRVAAGYQLGRLIGVEAEVRAAGEPELTPAPVGNGRMVEQLVLDAPAVLAAEAAAEAASAGVDAARSRYWPSLRLSTGYDFFGQGASLASPVPSWSVRLGLSFTIFDGFVREEAIERARVQDMVALSELADTRRAVRAEAERARGQIMLAIERISLAEQAVDVAQEDLRVQQERYELGVSTILDLLASQSSVVQAESDLVTARFDYQIARAELAALAGRSM